MKSVFCGLLLLSLCLVGCGGGALAKSALPTPIPTPSNPAPPPAPPATPPPPTQPTTPPPTTPTTPPTTPPPPSPPPIPVNWETEDLPPITGGDAAQANALNNLGHAVGYSVVAGIAHATLWVNGVATDLGANTAANGINDSDKIVGYRIDGFGFAHAHLWPDDIDLPSMSDFDSSMATGINSSGEVVGVAYAQMDSSSQNGFSWTVAGGLVRIPNCYSAEAVNDSGQIAGLDGNVQAGICGDNGTDSGHTGVATAINNSGTAVGFDSDGTAWIFPNTNLGPTVATGINDNGWVVGNSITPIDGSVRHVVQGNSHPWFWTDQSGLVNLGINTAAAINRSGQIAGNWILPDGTTHGALLNPVF